MCFVVGDDVDVCVGVWCDLFVDVVGVCEMVDCVEFCGEVCFDCEVW